MQVERTMPSGHVLKPLPKRAYFRPGSQVSHDHARHHKQSSGPSIALSYLPCLAVVVDYAEADTARVGCELYSHRGAAAFLFAKKEQDIERGWPWARRSLRR